MPRYKPIGNPHETDCVIAHSFGTSTYQGSVNSQLGEMALGIADGRPIIADRTLVDSVPGASSSFAIVVEGEVTNLKMEGVGTWGTLLAAKQFMQENSLESAAQIAQAHHVTRVARQAAKLSIVSVVPEGLPTNFDPDSDQRWTRRKSLWVPFNFLGSIELKRRGQL